ncbi:MAG: hypothetical protein N2485_03940 [bacterium]|nr:hypothetical protein [bacterium]
MSRVRYIVVVSEINSDNVKLVFEDKSFFYFPKDKLPKDIYIGQILELSFKTTTFLTIIKKIENNIEKNLNKKKFLPNDYKKN